MPSVFEHMKSLCLDEEIISPYQLHEREEAERHSEQQSNTRWRFIQPNGRTAEEEAIAAIQGGSPQYSQIVAQLMDEITKYIALVKIRILEAREEEEVVDP
jgi:hypothetical protein